MQNNYNIFSRRVYKDHEGVEKAKWYRVGYLKNTENNGKFMKLFHMPDTSFYLFDSSEGIPEFQTES